MNCRSISLQVLIFNFRIKCIFVSITQSACQPFGFFYHFDFEQGIFNFVQKLYQTCI